MPRFLGGDSESTMATEVLYAVIGVLVAIILINVAVLICWKFRKSRNRMTGYHGGPKPSWEIAAKDLSLYEYNEQDSRKLSADCASLYSQVNAWTREDSVQSFTEKIHITAEDLVGSVPQICHVTSACCVNIVLEGAFRDSFANQTIRQEFDTPLDLI